MYAITKIEGRQLKFDLSKPIDISIPLQNGCSPVAFGASPFRATPYTSGGFIGALEQGSPVNFYDLHINPHGNGTHTESVLHIDKRGKSINQTLLKSHFLCQLITVHPSLNTKGDMLVDKESFPGDINISNDVRALIIRTLPNDPEKKSRNYTGTNPCYFTPKVMSMINDTGIEHLLVDIPSIDKEQDDGALKSHKEFWKTEEGIETHKTITEMVYIEDDVNDGIYLLNLQIISLESDASPSKPVIYQIIED